MSLTPNEITALAGDIANQVFDRLANRPKLVDSHALAQILSSAVPTHVMVGVRGMYCPDSAIPELRAEGGDEQWP